MAGATSWGGTSRAARSRTFRCFLAPYHPPNRLTPSIGIRTEDFSHTQFVNEPAIERLIKRMGQYHCRNAGVERSVSTANTTVVDKQLCFL